MSLANQRKETMEAGRKKLDDSSRLLCLLKNSCRLIAEMYQIEYCFLAIT